MQSRARRLTVWRIIQRLFFVSLFLLIGLSFTKCENQSCDTFDPTCSREAAILLYNYLTAGSPGPQIFVAVGNGGTVFTTRDGKTLTYGTLNVATPSDYNLYGVAYGGGVYVAVGNNTTAAGTPASIFYSSDGLNWTRAYESGTYILYDVVYGGGRFIAVGNAGAGQAYVLTSTNGTTWTNLTTSSAPAVNLNRITYGNNVFMASGSSGTSSYKYDSTLGSWSAYAYNGGAGPFTGIAYGNERFSVIMLSAAQYMDTNPLIPTKYTWIAGSGPAALAYNDLTYGYSRFVGVGAAGAGNVIISSDGSTYTASPANTTYALSSVASGNGQNVAVSTGGAVCRDSDGTALAWSCVVILPVMNGITFAGTP